MRIFKRLTWREIFTIGLVFGVTGCATSGLSGTTKLQSTYDSQVMADGTDHTKVNITASGKAGDVLQAVSNASLMTKDGTGAERNMMFGANQNNDASQRDDAIQAVNATWAPVVNQLMGMVVQLAGIASPLIGQHADLQAQQDVANTAAKAQFRTQLIEMLRDPAVLDAMRAGTPQLPVRPVAPRPVVTPPVVTPTPDPVPPVVTPPTPETPLTDGTLPAGTPIPVPEG